MEHLLIVAHGSRRNESTEEIEALARAVGEHPDNGYASTAFAFLELAKPSIGEAIDGCIERGATRISVLPYFLTVGTHVAFDIPAILEERQEQYPHVDIVQLDYIGKSGDMQGLLIESLRRSVPAIRS